MLATMFKRIAMLQGYRQPGRLLFLVGCALLLVTASGLYIRFAFIYVQHHASATVAGGVSSDLLRPILYATENPHTGDTGDQTAWHSAGPNLDDEVDNLSLLHPEKHIFRDPTTIRMKWNITLEQRAPDGVMKPVYLINGEWSQLKVSEYGNLP